MGDGRFEITLSELVEVGEQGAGAVEGILAADDRLKAGQAVLRAGLGELCRAGKFAGLVVFAGGIA